MNNNFYKIVKKLRDTVESNPIVNTVVYARTEEKDLYKNSKYVLVHINPAPSSWVNDKSNIYTFEIGVFDKREATSQTKDTVFEGNDNIIDNHNTCYAILNEVLSVLHRQNEDEIYLDSVGQITPVYLSDTKGLDGWVTTITFKLPNKLNVC